MQFHNPEVLFALFLLIIPIIVHLFQLRRFRRENFTNVKFLRRITLQTRKSSQLKKLLVLATRLLLLACIIFAFARPYFPEENQITGNPRTVVYLDNSYSMQAEGQRGNLLERSKQELLEQLPEDHEITLITNSEEYRNVTRQDIQEIDFSPLPVDLNTIFLKVENILSGGGTENKKFLLISDFKEEFEIPSALEKSAIDIYAMPLRPQNFNNVSIDTLFYTASTPGAGTLSVNISYSGSDPGSVPVSLYNGSILLGKTSVEFNEASQEIKFPISEEEILEGLVQIEDNGLQFDNILYFSLNSSQPVNITSINAADAGFLNRIYTEPEFIFSPMDADRVDYNILSDAQVVVLNEIEDVSAALATTLLSLVEENVIIVIIPGSQMGAGMISLLNNLGLSGIPVKQDIEKMITGISFEHPLYEGVFDDRVRNFEYPRVQLSYRIGSGSSGILIFEDKSPFLINLGNNYLFTAPLNRDNSNFSQSPLIVPTFYNIGISALKSPQLYYDLGSDNSFEIRTNISGDNILEIGTAGQTFIPRQQSFVNKVRITTNDLPDEPGNFKVFNRDENIAAISYNIDRSESKMDYSDLPGNTPNLKRVEGLNEFFTAAGFNKEVDTFWKWFVTFALILLVVETLLLKYFK